MTFPSDLSVDDVSNNQSYPVKFDENGVQGTLLLPLSMTLEVGSTYTTRAWGWTKEIRITEVKNRLGSKPPGREYTFTVEAAG